MWPHRRPIRLPHPWASPGKNTGVGCHFLLQCMKVKSEREVAQSCLILSDPMDCSPPGSSVHGIFPGVGCHRQCKTKIRLTVWPLQPRKVTQHHSKLLYMYQGWQDLGHLLLNIPWKKSQVMMKFLNPKALPSYYLTSFRIKLICSLPRVLKGLIYLKSWMTTEMKAERSI